MRYKISNKTILTSALVSLISLSTQQALAQEVFDTESDDVLGVLPNAPAEAVEDDIIPVSGEALIAPQKEVTSEVKTKEKDKSQDKQDFISNDLFEKPQTQEAPADPKEPTAPIQANVNTEKVEAPVKADLLPSDDDFEIDFDDEAPVVAVENKVIEPQNEPKKPIHAPRVAPRAKTAPNAPKREIPARPSMPAAQNQEITPELTFGEAILVKTNNDLFTQMSDIEKQTTLLTLELKKEKIKNEIEAAKAVREKALFEKQATEEAKKRAQIEWEKEQEAKVFRAQAELKQKEIELEKIKQRKALTAYMNTMLEQKQSWVNENAKLYDEMKSLKEKNATMRQTYQKGLGEISNKMTDLMQSAETAQKDHDRAIVSLTAQNTQLKKRIEATEKAFQSADGNPFAAGAIASGVGPNGKLQTSADSLIAPISVATEYAIVEIIGKGDILTVKLMNKDGETFVAKQGTVLQTGHMVEEITPRFVRFSRNGLEDFLYTSANAMEVEQTSLSGTDKAVANAQKAVKEPVIPLIQEPKKQEEDNSLNIITESSLPSLGSTMFIK